MLRVMIYSLTLILTLDLSLAEDHKEWALQQQEKSQELVNQFRQEALSLTPKKTPIKGCQAAKESARDSRCFSGKAKRTSPANPTLYIFVSFSMPKGTLKSLAIEAKKHNAILVIRGLIDNSFQKTAQFLQSVGEGVILDPTLFKEYDIKVVPTFVITHKNDFMRMTGNVSVAYVLEQFKEGVE